jgi:threonine/homoserine/homoserine lactone efflux protein
LTPESPHLVTEAVMDIAFFWKGLLIGLAIAAPVGPIAILCIRRTLENGIWNGLATGIGAATADAIYGAIAAFGIAAVSSRLVAQETPIRLLGGLALIVIGWRMFTAELRDAHAQTAVYGVGRAYLSSVFLTLTNPSTILYFVAVFAGLGLAESGTTGSRAVVLVTGVFLGSVAWWIMLVLLVSQFRRFITPTRRRYINRASGIILITFGAIAIYSIV